jgi:hypothetical protein
VIDAPLTLSSARPAMSNPRFVAGRPEYPPNDDPPQGGDGRGYPGVAGIFDAADGLRLRKRDAAGAKHYHGERTHGAVDGVDDRRIEVG